MAVTLVLAVPPKNPVPAIAIVLYPLSGPIEGVGIVTVGTAVVIVTEPVLVARDPLVFSTIIWYVPTGTPEGRIAGFIERSSKMLKELKLIPLDNFMVAILAAVLAP